MNKSVSNPVTLLLIALSICTVLFINGWFLLSQADRRLTFQPLCDWICDFCAGTFNCTCKIFQDSFFLFFFSFFSNVMISND